MPNTIVFVTAGPATSFFTAMHVGEQKEKLTADGQEIAVVSRFSYLGSIVREGGSVDDDTRIRCGKGSDVFEKMRPVWSCKKVGPNTKIRLYKAIVVPTVLHASETWRTTKAINRKLDAFQGKCLRRILGVTYRDRIKNEDVMKRTGQGRLQDVVAARRLQFWGHVT